MTVEIYKGHLKAICQARFRPIQWLAFCLFVLVLPLSWGFSCSWKGAAIQVLCEQFHSTKSNYLFKEALAIVRTFTGWTIASMSLPHTSKVSGWKEKRKRGFTGETEYQLQVTKFQAAVGNFLSRVQTGTAWG